MSFTFMPFMQRLVGFSREGAIERLNVRQSDAEPMRMWPISTTVNKPGNDDPSIVEPVALSSSAA
jgi:hypothetical protein